MASTPTTGTSKWTSDWTRNFVYEGAHLSPFIQKYLRANIAKLVAFSAAVEKNCMLSGRVLAVVIGFAMIWHIWWMAILGLVGAFAAILVFAFRDEDEIEIPAERIAKFDRIHPAEVAL